MKTTDLVSAIGAKHYLRYQRANLLNVLKYSRGIRGSIQDYLNDDELEIAKKCRRIDLLLRKKVVSYYAAKHDGFKSLAEAWGGMPISDFGSDTKDFRRSFSVKPASWFKVEDAYNILASHADDCESILDPFNGWGARAAGALLLNKGYIGVDANPLLHSELTDIYSDFDAVEFNLANAYDYDFSTYEGVDCIFTCPPYWKCEDYGYRIKYDRTYNEFLKGIIKLFESIQRQTRARKIIISTESFWYRNKKYSLDSDLFVMFKDIGWIGEEIVYREMKRTYNDDYRPLKCLVFKFGK